MPLENWGRLRQRNHKVLGKTSKIGSLSINAKILALTITLMICSSVLVSLFVIKRFEREIMPEMDKKAFTVGESVNSLITRALSYGIPFRSLKGTKELFDSALEDNPEIKYIAVTDPKGDILYNGGEDLESLLSFFKEQSDKSSQDSRKLITISGYYDNAIPIVDGTNVLGSLHIGVDRMFVQNKVKDISYDIVTVLVVSFLITFEILIFITALPYRGLLIRLKS